MKNLYTILTAFVLASPSIGKALMPHDSVASAKIIHFGVDQDSAISNYKLTGGDIIVKKNELTLNLYRQNNCLPSQVCPMMAPRPFIYAAKIVNIKQSCGSTYYIAVDDKTPVDGARIEIVVADHSNRVCEDRVPFITEVKLEESVYSRSSAKLLKFNHYFGANQLYYWNF